MKPRTDEAARLEADYLARIRTALGGTGNEDEICRSVREHIEEAVAEFKGLEVTLVQMAQVIERLGPPEAYRESAPAPRKAASPETIRLLDKLWLAALIKTVGLYVPVIDFYICGLIGCVMMGSVLKGDLSAEFKSVRRYAWITAALMVVTVPIAILSMMQPMAGILQLPVGIALCVVPLMLYWNLIGGIGSLLRTAGETGMASSLLESRRTYVAIQIVLIALALVVGVVIALASRDRQSMNLATAVIGLSLLPVGWVLGYAFMLKPISRARRALAGASPVPQAA